MSQIFQRTEQFSIISETRTIKGYAAKYNSQSVPLENGVIETLLPGCFDDVFSDSSRLDLVRALINHDPNLLLARVSSDSLRLSLDDVGLKFELDMPKTSAGNDALALIERGDMKECSFGFRVKSDGYTMRGGFRYIRSISDLIDVSIVTFPAYRNTDVQLARSEYTVESLDAEIDRDMAENDLLLSETVTLIKIAESK